MTNTVEKETNGTSEFNPEQLTPRQKEIIAEAIKDRKNFSQYLFSTERQRILVRSDEVDPVVFLVYQTIDNEINKSEEQFNEEELETLRQWDGLGIDQKSEEEINQVIDTLAVEAMVNDQRSYYDGGEAPSMRQATLKTLGAYRQWKKAFQQDPKGASRKLANFRAYRNRIQESVYRKLVGEEMPDE